MWADRRRDVAVFSHFEPGPRSAFGARVALRTAISRVCDIGEMGQGGQFVHQASPVQNGVARALGGCLGSNKSHAHAENQGPHVD